MLWERTTPRIVSLRHGFTDQLSESKGITASGALGPLCVTCVAERCHRQHLWVLALWDTARLSCKRRRKKERKKKSSRMYHPQSKAANGPRDCLCCLQKGSPLLKPSCSLTLLPCGLHGSTGQKWLCSWLILCLKCKVLQS